MKFPPSSASAPSVFVNHQPGAVDHDDKRTALTVYFKRNVQRFRTFLKGRIIRNARFLNFEEGKHVPPKPFEASIGNAKDFANDRQRFNRRIAATKGTVATAALFFAVPEL